eukprot:4229362-Pyramimonas_sp.AAC.1
MAEDRALRMTVVLVGPPCVFGNKVLYETLLNILTCRPCVCDSATLASSATVLIRCLADHICTWQLLVRASRLTRGGARAKQQGDLRNLLSMSWTGMDKGLIRPNG